MFDPENPERADPDGTGMERHSAGGWVNSEDYDQLLALYYEAVARWRELRDGIDTLHFTLSAQPEPNDFGLPKIEEMRGILDRPQKQQ